MRSFWSGFITFLLYAAACLFVLGFFFLKNDNLEDIDQDASIELNVFNKKAEPTEKESVFREKKVSNYENEIIENTNGLADNEIETITTSIDTAASITSIQYENPLKNYNAQPFAVYGNSNTILIDCKFFSTIYKDRDNVKIPYGCINYGAEIKNILERDPKATLFITGFSATGESNSLGKKRAEYIKKLLLGVGIPDDKIKTNGSFQNISFVNNAAKGGVFMKMNSHISFSNTVASAASTNPIIVEQTFNKPFAYKEITSGFKGDYFYGDQKFTTYITKIKDYLQENSGKKVEIYAHTNTVGNEVDNMSIAQSNSLNAKKIIVQSGIPAFKVNSFPMGEKPMGMNRSKRCMIIIVK